MSRIYLDSCAVIYAIEGSPELQARIGAMLLPPNDTRLVRAASGRIEVIALNAQNP